MSVLFSPNEGATSPYKNPFGTRLEPATNRLRTRFNLEAYP